MPQANEILANHWRFPGITWDQFKAILAKERELEYEPHALAFYTMQNGKKEWYNRGKLGSLAAYYGYFGPF